MSDFIEIDGSEGEGGGQVLRSALALALHTGRAFRITNIRASRGKNPGLMRQHLAAVKLAAAVGAAEMQGAELGSMTLEFRPQTLICGRHHAAVGGAGSATLVIQTVLPALLLAPERTELVVEGGTHNMAAPPFDFIDRVYRPLLVRMGPWIAFELERHGFFPAGGGLIKATIDPVASLKPLSLESRGAPRQRLARALISRIPAHVGQKELDRVKSRMGWRELEIVEVPDSPGPGNVLQLEQVHDEACELVTAFGKIGRSAMTVADDAVDQMRAYLAHEAPVGEHLADQLLLPMAISGGGTFRCAAPSSHSRTNLDVIRRFLEIEAEFRQEDEKHWRFQVGSK